MYFCYECMHMHQSVDFLIDRFLDLKHQKAEASARIPSRTASPEELAVIHQQYDAIAEAKLKARRELRQRLTDLSMSELLELWKASKQARVSEEHEEVYEKAATDRTSYLIFRFINYWAKWMKTDAINRLTHVNFEAIVDNITQLLAFCQVPGNYGIARLWDLDELRYYLPLFQRAFRMQQAYENERALAFAMAQHSRLGSDACLLHSLDENSTRAILKLTERKKPYWL